MLKITLLTLLISLLLACNFNQSVNKDFTTGMYTRGNGIGVNNVDMVINKKTVTRTSFYYGEMIYFLFNNVTGLTKKDGNVYPGISIAIIHEKSKDTLVSNLDLFADNDKGFSLNPLQLSVNFAMSNNIKLNEDYNVHVYIWDKIGNGTFTLEMPFTVKHNEHLKVTNNNMSYSNIYVWNETQKCAVTDKKINANDKVILIYKDLEGLKTIDDIAFPIYSLIVTDGDNNVLSYNENIFEDIKVSGVPIDKINKDFPIVINNINSKKVSNPIHILTMISDKKSNNTLKVETDLIINQ